MRGRKPKAIPLDQAIDAAVAAYRKALVARTNARLYNHVDLVDVVTWHSKVALTERRAAKALELAERKVRRAADVEQDRLLQLAKDKK